MTQLLPPKKEVALALLERSNVDVYLDPRAKGVVVPPQFRKEPRLILKIGLNMPVPIPDLRLDDESMSCTLSFNRSPFYCVVPWSSCFAMVGEDGRGMVWPDDVPQELAVKVVDPDQPALARDADAKTPLDEGSQAPRSARGGSKADSSRSRAGGRPSKISREAGAPGPERGGDDAASAFAASPSKKKKGGKKKDEGRPMLVAVPSGNRSEGTPSGESAEAAGPSSARDRGRDGVSAIPLSNPSPGPSSSPGSRRSGGITPPSSQPSPSLRRPPPVSERPREGQVRPKRELPPYLRVVK